MPDQPFVTLRRTLQQAEHCIAEALAVSENAEDHRHTVADLEQARALIEVALAMMRGERVDYLKREPR